MNVERYLLELSKTYSPTAILDIGANIGNFSIFCHNLWPNCYIHMIEGNEACEENLKCLPFSYDIKLLSDSVKEIIYYVDRNNIKSTGNSYYKEITRHYKDAIEIRLLTSTLNDMEFNVNFDFIKLDGSVAKIIFLYFEAISISFTCYFDPNLITRITLL